MTRELSLTLPFSVIICSLYLEINILSHPSSLKPLLYQGLMRGSGIIITKMQTVYYKLNGAGHATDNDHERAC